MKWLSCFVPGLVLAFALSMLPIDVGSGVSEAFAKSDRGGGNEGGKGDGGKRGGHEKADKDSDKGGLGNKGKAAKSNQDEKKSGKSKDQKLTARLAGLNSLNRNYRALLNSHDPRMAGLRAFVIASANGETEGTDDEALRQALVDAANKNRVEQYGDDYINDDVMEWAKDVLGVGDRYGTIDQVREAIR
jgi:hypothetical protein